MKTIVIIQTGDKDTSDHAENPTGHLTEYLDKFSAGIMEKLDKILAAREPEDLQVIEGEQTFSPELVKAIADEVVGRFDEENLVKLLKSWEYKVTKIK